MYKDKLDYLIGLASVGCGDDDVEMFNNLDTSKVKFDEHFYKTRDRRIRRHKRKPIMKTLQKIASRVAIFLLAIISASVVTVAAIPSLRKAVARAIVEWYENYLTINYEIPEVEETESESGESEVESGTETETETEIVRPTEIVEVKKPSYYQEGLTEDVVIQTKNQVYIDYYLGEELLYSYKQLVFSEDAMYINNESATVQNVEINGYTAYLVEHNESFHKKIIWTDGSYIYQLTTESCSADLFISVAKSVK